MLTLIQPIRRRSLVLLLPLLLSCGDRERSAAPTVAQDLWQFTTLDSTEVPVLSLTAGETVPLGSGGPDSPKRISRLLLTSDAIFVLDEEGAAVRRYDRRGRLVFTVDGASQRAWRFGRTYAMAVRNDSLTLADMSWRRGATAISPSGDVLRSVPFEESASLNSVALADSVFVVGHLAIRAQLDSGTARLVTVFGADGARLAEGCTPDPIYQRSVRDRGLFGMFGGAGAGVQDSHIYCWQAVSPVVQVLRLDGQLESAIQFAPPFYRRGGDAPGSMDPEAVQRFSSTWTELGAFFPFPDGFLSVYSSFDLEAGKLAYSLFLCRGLQDETPACAMATIFDRPMGFLAPDTLVTVEGSDTPSTPPTLRLRVLR